MEIILIEDFYFFRCPNCNDEIIVHKNDLNCKIFRHAVYKNTYKQVDPHLPYEKCKELIENDKVFGCCKPFQIILKDNKLYVQICDYI